MRQIDPHSVFAPYGDQVHVSCDGTYLYVETDTGLPEHELMRGISSWILRVPIPLPG